MRQLRAADHRHGSGWKDGLDRILTRNFTAKCIGAVATEFIACKVGNIENVVILGASVGDYAIDNRGRALSFIVRHSSMSV